MRFTSTLNVTRTVEQLRQGSIKALHWIDNRDQSVHTGKLVSVSVKAKGLSLKLDSGKSIVWKMTKNLALDCFARFHFPVAVPIIASCKLARIPEWYAGKIDPTMMVISLAAQWHKPDQDAMIVDMSVFAEGLESWEGDYTPVAFV